MIGKKKIRQKDRKKEGTVKEGSVKISAPS